MLELGSVAALDVAERRIRLHDALFTEILQGHEIPTKRKDPKFELNVGCDF